VYRLNSLQVLENDLGTDERYFASVVSARVHVMCSG
jgi:hypothetical protein